VWNRINRWLSNLHAPKTPLGQCLFFAITQFSSYFLFVASIRATAQGNYVWTVIVDSVYGAQAFMMAMVISRLAIKDDSRGLWGGIGYTIGGALGSIMGIYLTKIWYGH